ncbi:hypothetical protein N802_13670 [Knoellia sinensis KCTC 19936]|uniref:Uncharacterized protein n=1 Tax=Knoellia sinensis KCTC 19936 TaxID=1385520 RepID=A0A0A0IYC9_9MICO|nr:hypothetical protein [Knoellia sinensis]KGN29434.1 hypothetical protein N802_13670 [Knoellia sinensis KCTC 19936]
MNPHPTREDARRRLHEAQRAEATALAKTTKAYAARARVQQRVDFADQNIAEAVAKLAEISGLDRAAQLLDQPLGVVKRAVQSSERSRSRNNTSPETSP